VYICAMKKLVFIVEDNLVQQKMLQVHFEETLGNYTVRTFDHPQDMLALLKEKPFAVVLDHFFNDSAGKTGLDFLRLLREKYATIPVIYYTTLEDENVKKQVMELGAELYIIKNSASLVYLRTALDALHEKFEKRGFFTKLFGV
jgi:CheY-like chemotaxis protein